MASLLQFLPTFYQFYQLQSDQWLIMNVTVKLCMYVDESSFLFSPLMQWAPVPDTACPSPAAGGSTSLGHPGPGSPVPSTLERWWDLDCTTLQWLDPLGPNTLKPLGIRAATWCSGWRQQSINITTTLNIHFFHNGWKIVLGDFNTSIQFGKPLERLCCSTQLIKP